MIRLLQAICQWKRCSEVFTGDITVHFGLFVHIHINSRRVILQQYLGKFSRAGTSAPWFSLSPVRNDVHDISPEKTASSPAFAEPFLPTMKVLYQMLKHELIIWNIFSKLAICSHVKKKPRVIVTPGDTYCFAYTYTPLFPHILGYWKLPASAMWSGVEL